MSTTNKTNKNTKTDSKTERRRRPISGMIMFGLAFLIVAFVGIAHFIVLDECGSPCRGGEATEECQNEPCNYWTLWDEISYRLNSAMISEPKQPQPRKEAKLENVIKTVANYYSRGHDVTFTYGVSGITVEYDEQVVCIQAPCEDRHVTHRLHFSEEHLDMVYDFLSDLESGTDYSDLDYTEKRIVYSAVANSEKDIDLFEVYYYDAASRTRYTIQERSGDVAVVANGNTNAKIPTLSEEQQESLAELVHHICEIEDNFRVNYTQDIESELEADEVKLFYQALGLSSANNNGADNNNKDNKNNGDTGGSGNTNNTSSNV